MISRYAVRLAAGAVALGCLSALSLRSQAQGAPFTIRRPPDGSTVRETVRVQIPASSIGPDSFVVMYIDGKFDAALDPHRPEPVTEGPIGSKTTGSDRFFTYLWNTKALGVSDGPHSVRAVLFDPVAGGNPISVTQRSTSEVKLTVANQISDGPATLLLRYKYPDSHNIEYKRASKSVRVGGGTHTSNSDQDLAAINSKLLLHILSGEPKGLSLVRNKLTSLSILSNGSEVNYPSSQLSGSMYQELDENGRVHYETGSTSGLLEFAAQGLPVDNTLELPVLPTQAVAKGQTWITPEQRIDVPGLPPAVQPRAQLQNTLVDLEWEGNYRTAKIHQHADNVKLPELFDFAQIPVMGGSATYDRDIYIAYTSGTLVKVSRTITIKGRTTSQPAEDSAGSFGGGGISGSGGGMFGGGRPAGVPGSYGMPGGPGMMGGPGGSAGMMGGPGGSGGMMTPGGKGGRPRGGQSRVDARDRLVARRDAHNRANGDFFPRPGRGIRRGTCCDDASGALARLLAYSPGRACSPYFLGNCAPLGWNPYRDRSGHHPT